MWSIFIRRSCWRNVPWHRTPEERWFNKMVSMVAMDLISDKIMSNTPRGVPYDDPTGGDKLITNSLITAYNHYNYVQVDTVIDDSAGYAVFYALGAYLVHAYGGAALFRDIIHNDKAGIEAIEAGLHTQSHDVSFDDVLQDWAVANLLSDNTAAPHPFRYNSGTWSESEAGGVTFRLGSINLFNYRFWYGDRHQDGPRFFTVATFNESAQQPHSNRFVALGDVSGEVRLALTAPRDNRLTVVVKGGTASVVTNRGKLVVPVAAYP